LNANWAFIPSKAQKIGFKRQHPHLNYLTVSSRFESKNMKLRPWIAFTSAVILLLGLWSCLKDQSPEQTSSGVQFDEVKLFKSSKDCAEQSNNCAKVVVQYPVMTTGKEEVKKKINQITEQKVLESLAVFSDHDNTLVVNLDSAIADFIELYEDYVTDSEFFTIPWELKIKGQIINKSDNMVCLRLENNSYTGGAHPNHYTTMLNFNTNTGDLLELKDVVRNVEEFKNIAEDILLGRNKRRVEPSDEPLIELTSDSYFMLPENFAIQDDGILLYYNPYEASDYANGAVSFLVSFDELKPILSKNFKLSD
jgi:hypothetical protein